MNEKICCGLLNSAMHTHKTALWHCLPLHWWVCHCQLR